MNVIGDSFGAGIVDHLSRAELEAQNNDDDDDGGLKAKDIEEGLPVYEPHADTIQNCKWSYMHVTSKQ